MIKTQITDGLGTKRQVYVDDQHALLVAMTSCPSDRPQKNILFRHYLTWDGLSTGYFDMRSAILVNRTDGVCADHTGPTYTFTSASGGLLGAQHIHITDTGATAHGKLGTYKVSSINSATSVELTEDPTDGTNETGLDFHQEISEFYIPSSTTKDRYITHIGFLLADASLDLAKFGAVTALTNGCDFEYVHGAGEIVTIHGALKTSWDFVRMCSGQPAFGSTTNAFICSNVFGASEGIIPVFNLVTMMPPYGLCLEAESTQKILIRLNDDTSGVDAFDAIAYGFERFRD